MIYMMYLFLGGVVLGFVGVASNPSPYFAALGLVMVSGAGSGLLVWFGGPFLSLVLFLIYLGGMLVVFAYSAALAAEPYPESWGSSSVLVYVLMYLVGVTVAAGVSWGGWYGESSVPVEELAGLSLCRGDMGGVSLMYSSGGGLLVVGAGALLLTLFVVLELTRGLGRGALRAV